MSWRPLRKNGSWRAWAWLRQASRRVRHQAHQASGPSSGDGAAPRGRRPQEGQRSLAVPGRISQRTCGPPERGRASFSSRWRTWRRARAPRRPSTSSKRSSAARPPGPSGRGGAEGWRSRPASRSTRTVKVNSWLARSSQPRTAAWSAAGSAAPEATSRPPPPAE
ncbi:MAG TPA: hypothetical protein VFE33_21130 [Thermoanaerobaculia bacterium]|nr:hypothetical protein [Thermoanaerobaculia bacterium]